MPQQGRPRQIVKILTSLVSISFFLNHTKYLPLVASIGIEYNLRYGSSAETPFLCIVFGMVFNWITGSAKWGKKLGTLANEINNEHGNEILRGRVLFISLYYLDHWSMPEALSALEKGQNECLRQGDHEYYVYHTCLSLYYLMFAGAPLDRILQKIAGEKAVLERLRNFFGLSFLDVFKRMFDNLKQGGTTPWELGSDLFGKDQFSKLLEDLVFYKFYTAFYCGRYDVAFKFKQDIESMIKRERISLPHYCFCFLAAIVEINEGKDPKQVKRYLKILKQCAENNPGVYQYRLLLAQAENFRVKGDLEKARDLFENVRIAQEEDPDALYEKALVLEKLSWIAESQNQTGKAKKLMQNAISLYRQWGLKWKHGVFDISTPIVREITKPAKNEFDSSSSFKKPRQGEEYQRDKIEKDLLTILDVSSAQAVHTVVRKSQQWKSRVYVSKDGINWPATFLDLPEKMLAFAGAANKVVKATALDAEEDFFDTAYFFKHQPESLVVIPGGTTKAICIENPQQDVNMETLTRLAEPIFKRLEQETGIYIDLPDKDNKEMLHLKACCQKLQDHMRRNESYRDPDLNIASLASVLGISKRLITDALNTCLGQNFNTFINSYRIEAVKKGMENLNVSAKTILEISFEQGFSSKTTFNRAFKAQTGMTPSEYKKTILRKGTLT
ncbi:MAG: helix-turn-helix domain-containing protein [Desulfobacteraceae bacterium]|nr:helix-turn-helix domain-containing protein [Desulfobacteraceae bacterium]